MNAKDKITLNTEVGMPRIGLGTSGLSPDTVAQAVVTLALHVGYRLIDTASMYRNESGVGAAIRDARVPREDIFLTTKLWNADQGYDSALRAFDASLGRLGLDYVDLYLIHWPTPGRDRRKQSWQALERLCEQGMAKNIGVSNYSVEHLQELSSYANIKPAVNQIELHPFVYDGQKDIVAYCQQQGIVVQGYSPLARGSRVRDPSVNVIAQELHKRNAQVLIRWCIQHGVVPLPRSTDERHIEQNIDVLSFKLSGTDMNILDNLYDGTRIAPDPHDIL